jgi:hypothetical protein
MIFYFTGLAGRTYQFTVESDRENLDLWAFASTANSRITNAKRVEIVIAEGVKVYGANPFTPAIVTGSGWNPDTELVLTVNGSVSGRGGAGGMGGRAETTSPPELGGNGGVAITTGRDITIINNGLIQGGTGGGGGGGYGPNSGSQGGGGGGGSAFGTGGIGSRDGNIGTFETGGSGGINIGFPAGNGGNGGTWLDSGTGVGAQGTSVSGGVQGAAGGNPGAAIVASAGTVSLTNNGTIYGTVPP